MTPGVSDYLRKHGIFYRGIIDKYSLGVVLEPLEGDEQYQGMLSIPYMTPSGVRAIKFRNVTPGAKPKFAQELGQKTRLYNVQAYFDADDMIGLAEGEIDAIAATERLNIPTIGIPGAETWSGDNAITWSTIFKDFRRVVVFADGDPVNEQTGLRPGEEMAKRIVNSLKWRAHVVACPEGEDVSSMVYAGRSEELLMHIRRSWDYDD